MDIFNEILWPQFVKIEKYSKLPLHEQVAAYDQYIQDLAIARQNWLSYQNKGRVPVIGVVGVLAQEESYILPSGQTEYFELLQEDGSQIYVTALIV